MMAAGTLWTELWGLSKVFNVEALTPNLTVFGDKGN